MGTTVAGQLLKHEADQAQRNPDHRPVGTRLAMAFFQTSRKRGPETANPHNERRVASMQKRPFTRFAIDSQA
jgi:hypothetical protein